MIIMIIIKKNLFYNIVVITVSFLEKETNVVITRGGTINDSRHRSNPTKKLPGYKSYVLLNRKIITNNHVFKSNNKHRRYISLFFFFCLATISQLPIAYEIYSVKYFFFYFLFFFLTSDWSYHISHNCLFFLYSTCIYRKSEKMIRNIWHWKIECIYIMEND